jgi:DNA-directed RNA polymerase specialized sigma24 family protein
MPDPRGLWEQLLQERPKLTSYLARLVGDREEAEDLVQQCYGKAWNHLSAGKLRPAEDGGNPIGWLYKVARSEACDYLKQRNRELELAIQWSELGVVEEMVADPTSDVQGAYECNEAGDWLHRCAAAHADAETLQAFLRRNDGDPWDEIARDLGWSPSKQVSQRQKDSRLRRAMRQAFRAHFGDAPPAPAPEATRLDGPREEDEA